MSAPMKKPLTNVTIGRKEFRIPQEEARAVLTLVESLSLRTHIKSEVVFKEVSKNRPYGAVYLRGMRTREGLSQKQLESLTGIPVSNISKYESGARKITEAAAKKLGKALGIPAQKLLQN